MQADDLLGQAAHNNVVWCDTVCRAHGRAGRFEADLWWSPRPAPRFYPNLVTLAPGGVAPERLAALRDQIDRGAGAGWGLKDSAAALDLSGLGFRALFEATWVGLPADAPLAGGAPQPAAWRRVTHPDELAAWEAAWDDAPAERVFPPALLDDPDVAVLAALRDGRIQGGAIANRSGAVAGLSNVFTRGEGGAAWWASVCAAARGVFPGRALVGYEHGDALEQALAVGWRPLGPLRVWLRDRV